MEENRNDIEILKAMIKENFEEQRKLIAKLETALEAVTSFNGKQMLDSRDMRLMLKVCDRTLIRWRNSGKLPFFKLSGKIYFWASDVYKFLREECLNEDFISDSIYNRYQRDGRYKPFHRYRERTFSGTGKGRCP